MERKTRKNKLGVKEPGAFFFSLSLSRGDSVSHWKALFPLPPKFTSSLDTTDVNT